MHILGVNAYHGDASACLIVDGKIVAAVEEERFRRIKHWAGFPTEAIRYCLTAAGVGLNGIDHIAINSDPKANFFRKIGYVATQRPSIGLLLDSIKRRKRRLSVEEELAIGFPDVDLNGVIHRIEHHISHLASCFLVSPFNEAVVVSIDGFGDFSSAAWGLGRETKINVDGRVYFPHSLGIFYQAMTQYLGFPHYGDEYKVMGLAPYGNPTYLAEMQRIVHLNDDGSFALETSFFRHHKETIDYEWSGGAPSVGTLFGPALIELLGAPRNSNDSIERHHHDIARSVQAMYEKAFFNLLNALHARYNAAALTLAGGCAMNSVANGKVRRMTPFNQVYAQAAPGDAGGAIGAALYVWHKLNGPRSKEIPLGCSAKTDSATELKHIVMNHAYWGPEYANDEIDSLLKQLSGSLLSQDCTALHVDDELDLYRRTAELIANGLVIGWFQGRMEWGPRALGNRSIVCDPRRSDMKEILNLKIKRRESFRPFAPSILREYVAEWFEEEADVPFMMQVFQIKPEKRPLIPAVTHVDGSGRLQTVHRDSNWRFYCLIEAFRERTGIPMVLNTSFNENEPIVCRPDEALDCFLRTKMDTLVLGNWIVQRSEKIT